MTSLAPLLHRSASLQGHLCPWQVLAVRMGLYAGELFDVDVPRTDRRLLALVELDGCFADGITAATGCAIGQRTLRLIDHGKLAATFVEVTTGRAVRITPDPLADLHAVEYGPTGRHALTADAFAANRLAANRFTADPFASDGADEYGAPAVEMPHCVGGPRAWRAEQIEVYQTMPTGDLLRAQRVTLTVPLAKLVGSGHARALCSRCGEEIWHEREETLLGQQLCRQCAGERYFSPVGPSGALAVAHGGVPLGGQFGSPSGSPSGYLVGTMSCCPIGDPASPGGTPRAATFEVVSGGPYGPSPCAPLGTTDGTSRWQSGSGSLTGADSRLAARHSDLSADGLRDDTLASPSGRLVDIAHREEALV
ncbi:MAG: TraR/DksA C4-type zinc finger protein [Chloroflexi bacterium]|nr:TraR/DksA C4-type zinc finger protein [Chloroflexota bacterium]